MKNLFLFGTMLILLFSGCNQTKNNDSKTDLTTTIDSVSYGLGVLVANDFKKNTFYDSLKYDLFVKGFMARVDSDDIKIQPEEAQKILQTYSQQKSLTEAIANKKAGEEFLIQNAQKEGVQSLPSGLQYQILSEGKGESPDSNDIVTVNYEGRLIDGTVFDRSKDGQPARFPLNSVIEGWTEALLMMKQGAKWRIFVPSDLAYGDRGFPNTPIKPNSTLIFDIELLSVEKK